MTGPDAECCRISEFEITHPETIQGEAAIDISPTHVLINIIGGVALMLWSLKLVRLGVTRGFGAQLRRALTLSTGNRVFALLTGAVVTAFLQSSTATIMIISSFAGHAMVGTAAALALVLGADVGTTIVAQLLSFDLSLLSPIMLITGVVFFSLEKHSKAKNIGRVLIGLGLILLSLKIIGESSLPIKESETLPLILKPLRDDPFLAALIAMLITWLAHSSLAIVLLLMSLAASGVVPVTLAVPMVLGVNLGGTIAPLIATLRDSRAAIRIPAGNMMMRLVSVVALMPFIDIIPPLLEQTADSAARQVVNFHMAFNIGLALFFLPLTGLVAKLCTKAIPDRADPDDPGRTKYLNENEIDTPAIALASAERETLRMADILQTMLEDTIRAFRTNNETIVNRIREKDDVLDRLYSAFKRYMARLTQEYMSREDAQRYMQILTFATNLEHAGDVIDKNMMPMALKKIRNQGNFSQEGFREIENIHNWVLDSVRLAQTIFVSGNVDLARRMIEEKEKIRKEEVRASVSHIDRLRDGVPETIATTSLHLDIIRDYRRINSYMCAVAYTILEEKGHLHTSRLKERGE